MNRNELVIKKITGNMKEGFMYVNTWIPLCEIDNHCEFNV